MNSSFETKFLFIEGVVSMDHFPNDTIDKGVFVSAQVLIIAVVFLLCTEGIDTTWVPLIFLILQTCAKNVSQLSIVCPNLIEWPFAKDYRFCEFFAGDANLSYCFKQFGFRGLSFDSSYGGRFNNIMEPAGFACLASFIAGNVLKSSCQQMIDNIQAARNIKSIGMYGNF